MDFNVKSMVPEKDFRINGFSYIGAPKPNTAMFVTKKVEGLISTLRDYENCLVFAESGVTVPEEIMRRHAFVFDDNPRLRYAQLAQQAADEKQREESKLKYIKTDNGAFISETARIGDNAYIEPGCVIGPDVVIGKNARILAGAIIRNAIIGDHFAAHEHSVIGSSGFNVMEDENGNKVRMPTLGRVIIGDNVEVGPHDNISCGAAGDTVLEDNVKLNSYVHLGHDVHLHSNIIISAGSLIAGFTEIGENARVNIGATVRNRLSIGENAVIGMGAVVVKSVESNMTVVGNPAKPLVK